MSRQMVSAMASMQGHIRARPTGSVWILLWLVLRENINLATVYDLIVKFCSMTRNAKKPELHQPLEESGPLCGLSCS